MLEANYKLYNELDGYQNKISIKKDTLTSTTTIEYSKIDIKKLISLDRNNASLIKNSKIKVSDMRKIYEDMGAICKTKYTK